MTNVAMMPFTTELNEGPPPFPGKSLPGPLPLSELLGYLGGVQPPILPVPYGVIVGPMPDAGSNVPLYGSTGYSGLGSPPPVLIISYTKL